MENSPIFEINDLVVFHGRVQALWNINIKIQQSEIVGIIGSNGAGKTTLLNTISGLLHSTTGRVIFEGHRIDRLSPHEIVELGICHIPESRKLFPDMSVRENLEMGAYPRRVWRQREETLAGVYQIFPVLRERARQLARTLSGGEQQMLAMGRGLMSRPKLCLIDEPSYGLAPKFVSEVFSVIQSMRKQGITVLLVEQNVRRSLEISDRAYVLENGRIILEGPCNMCLESEHVKKAYLGL